MAQRTSKIVKRLRNQKSALGLVLGPSTALSISFLDHYTLTNKAMGTI